MFYYLNKYKMLGFYRMYCMYLLTLSLSSCRLLCLSMLSLCYSYVGCEYVPLDPEPLLL